MRTGSLLVEGHNSSSLPSLLRRHERRCGHHRRRGARILRLIGSIIGVPLPLGRRTVAFSGGRRVRSCCRCQRLMSSRGLCAVRNASLGGASITCKNPNVSKACTYYTDFRRSFISVYAVSISFIRALASTSPWGLSFTWRMNLPVPSNRPSGSAISAPRKNPTLT